MNNAEARAYAIDVLRRRMQHPRFSRERFLSTVHEGAGGPDEPGWEVRSGKMTAPWVDGHTFRLADLFDEIDSPQGGLFA